METRGLNSDFSILGAPISLRNFRRDYDDDNDGYGLAAAGFPVADPDSDHPPDDVDSRNDVDSDDDTYSRGRKRRFHSTSSSSQSPYRSCKSSMSPQNSISESDEARGFSEELDESLYPKPEEQARGFSEELDESLYPKPKEQVRGFSEEMDETLYPNHKGQVRRFSEELEENSYSKHKEQVRRFSEVLDENLYSKPLEQARGFSEQLDETLYSKHEEQARGFSEEMDENCKREDQKSRDPEEHLYKSCSPTQRTRTKGTVCLFNNREVEEEEEDYEEECWKDLPVILLEDIFVLLSPKQRHQASMVCRPWYEIFYSPRVWETFVLFETTLTRRRFSAYKGYQRELCPGKTHLCLMRVGCFFKRIVVTPISDYYSLYEFLRVLVAFLELNDHFPMPLLHTFRFTFACESRGMNGVVIIGTGGNILRKVKDLVSNMQQLRHLALNHLLLDEVEVPGLLEAAATHCTHTLLSLELLNCSKVPLPIPAVTQFSKLVKLKLSPQHLSEEVVLLLGGTSLRQLHIVQDAYTCSCQPVSGQAWKLFKEMAPKKRVFLEIQGLTKNPLMLQPHAPVRGVIFRTPYHRLHPDLTTWLIEYYGKYLEYFVQERLPRAHGSRKFSERADESLLRLVRTCPRLHTMVIRERISLATLLLLAQEGKHLRVLIARRNALLKKCEWPRAKHWSQEFLAWLRRHGRNYELAFQQMPLVFGQRWKPTEDRSFKHLMMHIT